MPLRQNRTQLDKIRKLEEVDCTATTLLEKRAMGGQPTMETRDSKDHSTANCDFPTRNIHRNFHRC